MNDFELMRSLPTGQYLPLDSPIHRLDPRIRLLCSLCLISAAIFSTQLWGLVAGFFILLLGFKLARVPFALGLKSLLVSIPFILLLALMQIVFNPYVDRGILFSLGPLVLSWTDLYIAGLLILRFVVLMMLLNLTSFVLSASDITVALQSLLSPLAALRIPVNDLIQIIQVTLRYLPLLTQTAERIARAQASRGAAWGASQGSLIQRARQIIPLLIPLLTISLRRAENLALAMDARAYGIHPQRTCRKVLTLKIKDAAALVLSIAASLAILIL
ncbi:MAG TPA: energy-coupling factor transporter transmembrane component T [Anaerolineaceae bacterium]|nr:energy-coupling factor transporter transmembrane component T [Anaerolineaceae bacterium]HPN50315.1 energy-coupling factor transporter transmembrane component T [Anaerolineaceae bacterium]